jgi:hypothetical protein
VSDLTFRISDDVVETIAARAAELVREQLQLEQSGSPYASVDEAAAFLRCKPQRIYELRTSGLLTRYTDGGRALVLWSELQALVIDEDLPPARRVRKVA